MQIGRAQIFLDDAFAGMSRLPDQSFDLAIADPPYGASTRSDWHLPEEHGLERFGGAWKLASHQWDLLSGLDSFQMSMAWLFELKRLVKPAGSIWIHSTYHNSGIVNVCCQLLGLEIINEVVWYKRNAFPNLAGRRLTASHETILWVHTGGARREYFFNYDASKNMPCPSDGLKQPGKQMRTVWDIPNNKEKSELECGRHPTQKPVKIAQRILSISAQPGGKLLVPFLGSGSEAVAGLRHGMEVVGFEIDPEIFGIAEKRVRREIEQCEPHCVIV